MTDDLEQRAYEDLDEIAEDARKARKALNRGKEKTAEAYIENIIETAESWEDP